MSHFSRSLTQHETELYRSTVARQSRGRSARGVAAGHGLALHRSTIALKAAVNPRRGVHLIVGSSQQQRNLVEDAARLGLLSSAQGDHCRVGAGHIMR